VIETGKGETIRSAYGHAPELDGLRGVAILMVPMPHFYNEAEINGHYVLLGPLSGFAFLPRTPDNSEMSSPRTRRHLCPVYPLWRSCHV